MLRRTSAEMLPAGDMATNEALSLVTLSFEWCACSNELKTVGRWHPWESRVQRSNVSGGG